jgi:hypothetical protein
MDSRPAASHLCHRARSRRAPPVSSCCPYKLRHIRRNDDIRGFWGRHSAAARVCPASLASCFRNRSARARFSCHWLTSPLGRLQRNSGCGSARYPATSPKEKYQRRSIVTAKREKPHGGARKMRARLLRRLPHEVKTARLQHHSSHFRPPRPGHPAQALQDTRRGNAALFRPHSQ